MNCTRVILVTPKLGIGGIQRALTNLANWLTSVGVDVYLVSCKREDVFYELNNDVKLIIPEFEYSLELGKISYYYKVIRYLRKTFKAIDAQNVISYGETFNPLAIIASRGLNKNMIISDRTSPDYKHRKITQLLRKATYPLVDTLILQTTRSLEYNQKKFPTIKQVVIPNFINRFNHIDQEKEKIILYVGRFAWEKAPMRLVQAFSKIEDKRGYKLTMCGDGPQFEEIKNFIDDLSLNSHIELKGKVKHPEKYYSKASIYVLPSVLEGFPNALCEAMSFGIASVCYNSIPYEDLGQSGKDFLVVGVDFDNLTDALNYLINDRTARDLLSENAKEINMRLSDIKIGEKYLHLLK
ncbi:MAG: glycosyltransferase [Flavobacteriaceae bacterium]|nr:glycosyltransferase [Flavobacteriaceae bacterium]